MTIPINNRVILIIGPTTSGKSTIAKRIQEQFDEKSILISHDGILMEVNKNQTQSEIDFEFRIRYITKIKEAVQNQENRLIIIDAVCLQSKNVLAILSTLKMSGLQDSVTLLKTNLPLELHLLFGKQRNDQQFREQTTREKLYSTILNQVGAYRGPLGSLGQEFPYTDEFIIQDPRKVEFTYSISASKQYKK